MATIKDVAKAAGVSIATVSRVVNNGPKVGNKTRERVLKLMAELGYTPNANARALVTQKSKTLGVVIPELNDPFFSALASEVEKVAQEQGMQLLLSTGKLTAESELKAIQLLVGQRCENIVAHSKLLDDETLIDLCNKLPGLILIDRHIEAIKERCIWLDNLEGGTIAGRHLMSQGHIKLAYINSNYQIDDPKLRLQGFKNVIETEGVRLEDNLITSAEPSLRGGEIAAQHLLAANLPFSAVFVYNDAMAIGAISVFEDNGFKVPEDISVIGFDDVLLSQYSRPKLTTLNYPIKLMARHAAELALANNKPESKITQAHKYIPSLIKRNSVSSR